MSFRTKSSLILCVFVAACLLAPGGAVGASTAVQTCAKRLGKAFKRFATDHVEVIGDCQIDSLKDDERADCALDEDVLEDLEKAADKLRREVRKCDDDALRQICPHGQRDETDLKEAVLNGEGGTAARLRALDANVFTTSYGGCPRPLGEISREAEDCADRLSKLLDDGLDEYSKCLVKCELNGLRKSGVEPCIDDLTAQPSDEKIIDCVERVLDDIDDGLNHRCDDDTIVELGCPLGFSSVSGVVPALTERLYDETVAISNGIFFSECAGGGGGGTEGGPTDPVPATLYPSLTETQIDCGQTLDAAFFGTDDELRLDADLDCSPAGLDSNGIIISASNVTFDGRGNWDVIGPSKTTNRTGTGILIGPGAKNVKVKRFRTISRYAKGISDWGDNHGLEIEDLTVRRNRAFGIQTSSPNVMVSDVKADRNAVGFQMSGDDSTLKDCRALRSEPIPNVGIHVMGFDADGDDQVVRINRCEIEGNVTGIIVAEGPHLLEDNDVRENLGDGIQVTSAGSKLESNSVKLNAGSGIIVSGDGNNITANRSDENGAHGYVITGLGNDINNNGAGSLTDQGNLGHGFWFSGFDSNVESNDAEANAGDGFLVEEDTLEFKSNTANDNALVGINVTVGGNNLDTNVSEDNVGFEFSIAPGNVDEQGNRADGATFSFDVGGGNF